MIRDDAFWEKELEAPLLDRNAGFLTKASVGEVVQRAQQWLDLVDEKNSLELPEWKTSCPDPANQRIFQLDAERTFKDQQHKRDLIETLATVYQEIDDYHQGLGFIVAFLLLFLDKKDVAKIVLSLHRHYVPGYFKSAPINYVRDAKTYERILQKFFPKVHEHVTSMIPAEAYCSKWFVGFNVHVLTFSALADFFDAFLTTGQEFHFKYAMALIQNTEKDILATKDVSKVLAILRLDAEEYPDCFEASIGDDNSKSIFKNIVDDAIAFQLTDVDIDALREEVLEEMAEAARKRKEREAELNEEDEIVFSDEEDDSDVTVSSSQSRH